MFWFTLEFGVAMEDGVLRTYGAGLLSSFGEITNFRNADVRPFDTDAMGKFSDYEISTFQEVLFAAASFDDAEARLLRFFDQLARLVVGDSQRSLIVKRRTSPRTTRSNRG